MEGSRMPTVESLRQELHEAEERLLSELRDMRRGLRKGGTAERPSDSLTMGQNRQQDIDRKEAENDHQINIKAELEIELLHQKIDQLREKEVLMLTQAVTDLTALLTKDRATADEPAT